MLLLICLPPEASHIIRIHPTRAKLKNKHPINLAVEAIFIYLFTDDDGGPGLSILPFRISRALNSRFLAGIFLTLSHFCSTPPSPIFIPCYVTTAMNPTTPQGTSGYGVIPPSGS